MVAIRSEALLIANGSARTGSMSGPRSIHAGYRLRPSARRLTFRSVSPSVSAGMASKHAVAVARIAGLRHASVWSDASLLPKRQAGLVAIAAAHLIAHFLAGRASRQSHCGSSPLRGAARDAGPTPATAP